MHNESPQAAADRLVLAEDRRRRTLYHAWIRGHKLPSTADRPVPPLTQPINQEPDSLVVVEQDFPIAV